MNPLVRAYGKQKRWVNWKLEDRKGKKTKLPYTIAGTLASSTDPKTWATFAEAQKASPDVGIVFAPDCLLLGIDIDKCLEGTNITHEEKELIAQFIVEADTYTEISPSGTGLHLFFTLSEPWKPTTNKRAPYELYTHGRYFTVTGKAYKEMKKVRTITPEEAKTLLEILGYPWAKTEAPQQALPVAPVGSELSDDSIVSKMFASKNGKDIEMLYRGDLSKHKNDGSAGDMALCSHLAFWTGKNSTQMERMWSASPLGSRKKTQERKDYRDRTIAAAIANCKEVYSTTPKGHGGAEKKIAEELELLFTTVARKDGFEKEYTLNTENVCRILRKHPDFMGRFRFDMFRGVYEILPHETEKWRLLEDNDAVNVQTYISVLFSFFGKVGKDMSYDAIMKVSKENAFDSALDFVKTLKWDGVARLDTWLVKTYGVKDNEYHRAVGSNWMKGMVKRIVYPGCKFDYVLVLEGEQGTKKSTSLSILGGDWHVETTMGTDSKDFFMQFGGKVIVEFSEGETLSRTEVKRMKAIITMQTDKYRPPYERTSQEFPRRCVFAMTTNQSEYLKDETGNRRWLPVTVAMAEADIKWLEDNREQMFAEAYHRAITLNESLHEFPKEATKAEQELRKIRYENEDIIVDWYRNKVKDLDKEYGITVHMAYRDVLNGGLSGRPIDKYTEMKITDVFKNALKLTKRRPTVDGIQGVRWFDDTKGVPAPREMDDVEKMVHDINHKW